VVRNNRRVCLIYCNDLSVDLAQISMHWLNDSQHAQRCMHYNFGAYICLGSKTATGLMDMLLLTNPVSTILQHMMSPQPPFIVSEIQSIKGTTFHSRLTSYIACVAVKRRSLQKMGWTVLSVPYFHWQALLPEMRQVLTVPACESFAMPTRAQIAPTRQAVTLPCLRVLEDANQGVLC